MDRTQHSLKVFLCHSSADKPIVRELHHRLCEEGWIDVWLDEMKLLPGQEWDIEIEKAVENADIVLACLSEHSVDKEGYVQKELRFVLNMAEEKPEGSIFVIPLRLDNCVVPRRLRHWQWIDYFPKNQRKFAYSRLLQSLKVRAEKLGISLNVAEKRSVLQAKVSVVKSNGTRTNRPKQITSVPLQIEDDEIENPAQFSLAPIASRGPKEVAQRGRSVVAKRSLPFMSIVASGFLVISLLIWGGSRLWTNLPRMTSEMTHTSQPSGTLTSQPRPSNTPSPTNTPVPPTPTLGVGSIMTGDDGMALLYVPAGEFTMGSNSGNPEESPVHTVYLDAFWIDQTEVTNGMYTKCVQDKVCSMPNKTNSATRDNYYGNPEFDNYPVIYVSWDDATAYCKWADRRLLTEAEWEKAARGNDSRDYPWGNSAPSENLLNDDGVVGDTTEVGIYPRGASPYGVLDMAGNVSEWVADWYREFYYANQPESNPPGPDRGSARVIRGGSWIANVCRSSYNNDLVSCGRGDSWNSFIWNDTIYYYNSSSDRKPLVTIYTWRRKWDAPTVVNNYYGFRCAMDATP